MAEGTDRKPRPRSGLVLTWSTIGIIVVGLVVFLGVSYAGVEYYTSSSEFCGTSCHTMDEQYTAWRKDKHHATNSANGGQAECIECHFLPGDKYSLKAKYEGARHLFAYLYDPKAPLPIRPKIPDGACLQSGCHAKEKFEDRELRYTEKVRFKHKVHFSEKALDGQPLTCDTCHFKVTAEKHFEVPKEICYLCHLKLEPPRLERADVVAAEEGIERVTFADRPSIDFNSGPSRCAICHEIPTTSLQSQLRKDDPLVKPITHQSMAEAKVPCESCHFEVVAGHGEIDTGNVVSNGCLTCHNRSAELLAKSADKQLMHDEHVTKVTADCFDCHSVIEHRNRSDHLDFVRNDCLLCHQDQHNYQKLLLAGTPVSENLSATPHLMFDVNVNCMGCHLKKEFEKGHAVRTGAPETCVACHTQEHRKMLQNWAKLLESDVEAVQEIALEANEALAAAEEKAEASVLEEARNKISAGTEFLNIVRYGNGVHNKKYAIMILDQAFVAFEETLELLGDQ